jgi:hypothetical protein
MGPDMQMRQGRQLRLAAVGGERQSSDWLCAFSTPETPLVITVSGITEAEMERALEGFPGGQRFRLERKTN